MRERARLIFLSISMLTATAFSQSTRFQHVFAPQGGPTALGEAPARSEICLNGRWQFAPVAGRPTTGPLPEPQSSDWQKQPLKIPSPWNVNAFPDEQGLGGDFRCFPSYPASWNHVEAGWMSRSFTVPKGWKGRRLLLHFDAVAGQTEVKVNGKIVGSHFDIFLPFDVDVTDAVRYGAENELRVGVRKASLFDVLGKFGRRTYQGGSMWGQAIAGIWQDVFLLAVPNVRVTDTFVKPDLRQGRLDAEVTLQNDTERPETVRLSGSVREWKSLAGKDVISAPDPKSTLASKPSLKLSVQPVRVPPHGSVTVNLSAPVSAEQLKTWSPESPNLYSLVCQLTDPKGHVEDIKATRFGWRQVDFAGGSVHLNGKPLIVRSDSWHFMGIPQMTRRYAWAWFRTLKDAHLNAVRLHAQPYPAFYLDVADEQGILVLDETAVWASDGGPKVDDPSYWTDTETHLRNLILRDRNHPSVFGWSVSNEVMAVVKNVFHAPKEVEDRVRKQYANWTAICRELDSTRPWISGDGEEDGDGTFPVFVIHYGDRGTLQRAKATGKPFGVGESGPAYYGTPKQIAEQAKDDRAYRSFEDRMLGVADVSYRSLYDQWETGANFRSVFNLVWYGLKPLEFGMSDPSRPPELGDGIGFPPFVEGVPGVQPERIGPYSSTLNPGYDPRLPLYSPWPLFDAIQSAQSEPPTPWKSAAPSMGSTKGPPRTMYAAAQVMASPEGRLASTLKDLGVPLDPQSGLIFVDGANPPDSSAKATIDQALKEGRTVFVWGAETKTLAKVNALLPFPLELTDRTASSLVAVRPSDLTTGLSPAQLYFSESSPSTILTHGLAGALMASAVPLLAASDTDWKRWNNQPETTKTAMVLRSERERKPSGVALAEASVGPGRLIVCTIPADPQTSQATKLNRTLLANLGLKLGEPAGQSSVLDASGNLNRLLVSGPFDASYRTDPNSGESMKLGALLDGHPWRTVAGDGSGFALPKGEVVYLSFWLYSPKPLDNLLLDPHLPKLELQLNEPGKTELWLGGKHIEGSPLLLQLGWNHLLIRVAKPEKPLSIKVVSSQPDYLTQMKGSTEKP